MVQIIDVVVPKELPDVPTVLVRLVVLLKRVPLPSRNGGRIVAFESIVEFMVRNKESTFLQWLSMLLSTPLLKSKVELFEVRLGIKPSNKHVVQS